MAAGNRIYVGAGTCGIAAGAEAVIERVEAFLRSKGVEAEITRVGCMGLCSQEVMVDVERSGAPRLTFGRVTPDDVDRLLDLYLVQGIVPADLVLGVTEGNSAFAAPVLEPGEPVENARIRPVAPLSELPTMARQVRVVLENCGIIDPENIDEYLNRQGYAALQHVLETMTPEDVVDVITASGLRGRGGAGFPTGRKWAFTLQSKDDVKYVVCNADEGDPGAFMDRSVLEGDPHRVLEGLAIAAYAVGAKTGYIYVRAEYPLAVKRLTKAIEQMKARGFLGENILGSGFSFDVQIKMGAGAFVCGEETALIASIEGERGIPRPRPPYPPVSGLWGHPTCINNVETLANVPAILRRGADWFKAMGTETSAGTKVFALTGKVRLSGLIEVPMGVTLREIVYDIGGGIEGDRPFKAAQMGGPSGGCIPADLIDTPIDYESLLSAGAMMGSGGMVIMDDQTCMVDVARFFLNFTRSESCGKCVPCREGTTRLYNMLNQLLTPEAGTYREREHLIEEIEELALGIKDASACGLGQTAPNPVLSTLRHFRDEYKAHALDLLCPAGQCAAFNTYVIDPERCTGCGICLRNCPSDAITGDKKQPHVIDPEKCIRCGECAEHCNFDAVRVIQGIVKEEAATHA